VDGQPGLMAPVSGRATRGCVVACDFLLCPLTHRSCFGHPRSGTHHPETMRIPADPRPAAAPIYGRPDAGIAAARRARSLGRHQADRLGVDDRVGAAVLVGRMPIVTARRLRCKTLSRPTGRRFAGLAGLRVHDAVSAFCERAVEITCRSLLTCSVAVLALLNNGVSAILADDSRPRARPRLASKGDCAGCTSHRPSYGGLARSAPYPGPTQGPPVKSGSSYPPTGTLPSQPSEIDTVHVRERRCGPKIPSDTSVMLYSAGDEVVVTGKANPARTYGS
jgi:hypothetical protein